ncbi:MAG: histidinol dehydrogenase, partial [Flavobacteriaceae bacterium]|nr:histidinol dehydrogenase [Flavobacteriaceae bacterium]
MKFIKNPLKQEWAELIQRPKMEQEELTDLVYNILNEVKEKGDEALIEYGKKFDKVALEQLRVNDIEFAVAQSLVSNPLKAAIEIAKNNIEKFHAGQKIEEQIIETTKGVQCWRKSVGVEKVGLYIPGGTAPLFSTILMLGIPANLAGCGEIVLCTPPNQDGAINPAILYTANLIGINQIYKVGGAQAIAAMAYGTETIPQVYKIF